MNNPHEGLNEMAWYTGARMHEETMLFQEVFGSEVKEKARHKQLIINKLSLTLFKKTQHYDPSFLNKLKTAKIISNYIM